jgi:ribonuclease HII
VKLSTQKGVIERQWLDQGFILAGIDEVGRGCLAGPVVTACVALDYNKLAELDEKTKLKIRDSKTLSAKQRDELLALISEISLDFAVGTACAREIETVGILPATFLAMNRAIAGLSKIKPDLILVDGNQSIRGQPIRQQTIVKGDSLCFSIAAASIIAKEHRDQYMRKQSEEHPHWGFERHVGYGTSAHISAINSHGICHLHRRNFAPIRDMASIGRV